MAAIGNPTLASRIRPSDEVLFQELQDESVLLDLKSGVYFGLDIVGTRIWQLLLALVTDMERQGLVVVS